MTNKLNRFNLKVMRLSGRQTAKFNKEITEIRNCIKKGIKFETKVNDIFIKDLIKICNQGVK